MEKTDLSIADWLSKAEAYCARAEHCAADVRRKLYEWGAPVDIFDAIEESLRAEGFIDDMRFCEAYVHDKVAFQRWGRVKIEAGLRALQLSSSAIRDALATIDEERYMANLHYLAAQRSDAGSPAWIRFLLQRGFTYEEIGKA